MSFFQQLGELVKRKFPQYQQQDSQDIGQRTVQKYPQYQQEPSRVSQAFSQIQQGIQDLPQNVGLVGKQFGQLAQSAFTRPPQSLGRFDPGSLYGAQKQGDPMAMVDIGLMAGSVTALKGPSQQVSRKVFQGFDDLSTTLLQRLKGKVDVSKQFVSDLTNMPELKQGERNLIRGILDEIPEGKLAVQEFADKVKSELLPLDNTPPMGPGGQRLRPGRYEGISLPKEIRGSIADYYERVYQSPIKTSAGQIHFGLQDFPNYFAHSRIEDLPTPTRRVIELQSDLFQKGRLEGEPLVDVMPRDIVRAVGRAEGRMPEAEALRHVPLDELRQRAAPALRGGAREFDEIMKGSIKTDRLSQLQPYRNTWYERIIKEEVKRAAQDGKTKLQFPVGETAMKIEGLGDVDNRWQINLGRTGDFSFRSVELKPENISVGQEIVQNGTHNWIITDVLGEGRFKAIPKKHLKNSGTFQPEQMNMYLQQFEETFDISGKVDTNNPIYRFYEKDIQKFLKRKYPAMRRIKDPQGVEWFEVPIAKEQGRMPVEAFGLIGAGIGAKKIMDRGMNIETAVEE